MMREANCPKCNADVSDSYEPDDWSCGVVAGWYCDDCNIGIGEGEIGYDEPREDDVPLTFVAAEKPPGVPLSELSGQPGKSGYGEFLRIAKSWGYD